MKPFTVEILKTDVLNSNGRIYPRDVMQNAIDAFKEKDRAFGTIGMPEGGQLDIASISHSVNNLRIREDGVVVGEVMVLETPQGKILRQLLDAGVKYDYRTAGIGKIDENGVISEYRIVSVSAVNDGATW